MLGWAAAAGTFAFQALALHNGPMSEVQPVLVTELVFVLVLRRMWIRQQVAAAWASALAVCLALAVFLIAAEPTGRDRIPQHQAETPRGSGVADLGRCWPDYAGFDGERRHR